MDDYTVNSDVITKSNTLYIRGRPIDKYEMLAGPWQGKNGVVFQAYDKLLHRIVALKIWLKLDPKDNRDKVQQGLDEARKMAQLHNNCVAQIYGGELIDNKIFYCSMEFVNGFTLREYLPHVSSLGRRWIIAYLYIDAISETTTPELAHGDAHDRNVMITCRTIKQNEPELFSFSQGVYYTREPQLKLVDFGTSRVLGRSGWRQRHWRTVKETVKKILKPFESLKDEIGSISAYSDDNKPSFYKTLLHILRREAEADLTFTSAEDFGEELFVLLSAKQRTSP